MRGASALALAALLGAGCAHQIRVDPAALEAAPRAADGGRPLLLVEGIGAVQRAFFFGYSFGASDALTNRIVMDLRRTRSFENVLPPAAASTAPEDAVRVRVDVVERADEHWGPNLGRAIAIGVSLLLLAPVLPIEVGYELELRAVATTCDDWIREIRSSATGELRYRVLFSNEYEGRAELTRDVTDRAIENLVAQLASDEPLRERVASLAREGDCQKEVIAP